MTVLITSTLLFSIPVYAYGYGIPKTTGGITPDPGKKVASLISRYGGYYIGDTNEKAVYLTFDNGYENGFTTPILDVLKKENVPAAFFVTGHYLNQNPELIQRMVNEGHIVGNHTWSHPNLMNLSSEEILDELDQVEKKYTEITGLEMQKYMRAPAGNFDEDVMKTTFEAGYTNVFWSLAYVDWDTSKQKGYQYAYDNVMERVHNGAIILMHSVSEDNAIALESIIVDLKKQGYDFKSLDGLIFDE